MFLLLAHATITPAVSASERVVLTAPETFPILSGRCGRIVVAAYRRMGLDACVRYLPTARSLKEANDGRATGELVRAMGMEVIYPNLVRVPVPVCPVQFVAFSKGIETEITGWESLSSFRVGSMRGIVKVEEITKKLDVQFTNTVDSLMRMLDLGRIDVAVMEPKAARRTIDKLGLTEIRASHTPLLDEELFTYVHKDHADLVPGLASALSAMTEDGTIARLLDQEFDPQALAQRLACE